MRNLIQVAKKQDIFEGFDETPLRRIMAMFVGKTIIVGRMQHII